MNIVKKRFLNNYSEIVERLIPDTIGWKEHFDQFLIKYRLASYFCINKKVLDAACGSGYFSNFLKQKGAKSVLGIDCDSEIINFANKNFSCSNVSFQVARVENLRSVFNECFDVVVSIETIEHVIEQNKVIENLHYLLNKEGFLIISTPNKQLSGNCNPFHVRELKLSEFKALVKKHFTIIKIIGYQINKKLFLKKTSKIHRFIAIHTPSWIKKAIPFTIKLNIGKVLNRKQKITYTLSDIKQTENEDDFENCYEWLIVAKKKYA